MMTSNVYCNSDDAFDYEGKPPRRKVKRKFKPTRKRRWPHAVFARRRIEHDRQQRQNAGR